MTHDNVMTIRQNMTRYDKATWSLEQLLGQGGYRLCAINVIFAQIGLAFAYTHTVANTLHQIWGLPMNWLFLGLGIFLCLQSLGPESLQCWALVREMQWFRMGHIMALGIWCIFQQWSPNVGNCKVEQHQTACHHRCFWALFCQEHDW